MIFGLSNKKEIGSWPSAEAGRGEIRKLRSSVSDVLRKMMALSLLVLHALLCALSKRKSLGKH